MNYHEREFMASGKDHEHVVDRQTGVAGIEPCTSSVLFEYGREPLRLIKQPMHFGTAQNSSSFQTELLLT